MTQGGKPDAETGVGAGSYQPKLLRGPSRILSDADLAALWSLLPPRYAIQDAVLIFSTGLHGCSLSTLYNRGARVAPSVLVVKSKEGRLFGAFVTHPWDLNLANRPLDQLGSGSSAARLATTASPASAFFAGSESRGQPWFGSGECFVFTLRPTLAKYTWNRSGKQLYIFQLSLSLSISLTTVQTRICSQREQVPAGAERLPGRRGRDDRRGSVARQGAVAGKERPLRDLRQRAVERPRYTL